MWKLLSQKPPLSNSVFISLFLQIFESALIAHERKIEKKLHPEGVWGVVKKLYNFVQWKKTVFFDSFQGNLAQK